MRSHSSSGWSGIYNVDQSGFKFIESSCLSFPSAEITDGSHHALLTTDISKLKRERFGDRDASNPMGKRWRRLKCYGRRLRNAKDFQEKLGQA